MRKMICIACPIGCHLEVSDDLIVTGNQCPKGETYAINELKNPMRIVTSTVVIEGAIHKRLPVRTASEIPKNLIMDCMKQINHVVVKAPVKMGDVIIKNVLNTGVDIIASRSMKKL
ncbi:DUF1667 domain-containing protein [Acidaminobacter sp. JC074]|uniref:DUF1667 domain-containing protein n=1 Tax=Acidaminobacter sp. JC074 TaxID=2530199 RepID=UPI002102797F|nr:DUF1667 domain-containing protein [Acidaminobacter sp. JC074]